MAREALRTRQLAIADDVFTHPVFGRHAEAMHAASIASMLAWSLIGRGRQGTRFVDGHRAGHDNSPAGREVETVDGKIALEEHWAIDETLNISGQPVAAGAFWDEVRRLLVDFRSDGSRTWMPTGSSSRSSD